MCYRSDDHVDLGGTVPFRVAPGFDGVFPVPKKKVTISITLGPGDKVEAETITEDLLDES